MDNIQKISVTGFIHNNGKVLILKRAEKEKFLSGYFEMPGGKVEFGESAEEALIREVKEEVDIDVKIVKPYSTFSYISDDGSKHTVDMQFVTKYDNIDNFKLSEDHDDFKWISKDEIDKYLISDLMKKAIREGFESLD